MKRILIIIGTVGIVLLLAFLLIIRSIMRQSVIKNIIIATEMYQGTPEEALISMLIDENAPMQERTHTAVWTLGQLKSEIALPILKDLYKEDPKGETCYGNHDSMLCQYEIYKAIGAIEKFQLFKFPNLKKVSLERVAGTE